MTDVFAVIIFALLNCFAGLNIILMSGRDHPFYLAETIGLSYLVGVSACGAVLFLFWWAGMPFKTVYVLCPFLILFVLNIKKNLSFARHIFSKIRWYRAFGAAEKISLALLIIVCVYILVKAMSQPVCAYDSVAIWSLKAKILFLTHPAPEGFYSLCQNSFHGAHADYPLAVPFNQLWFHVFNGKYDDYLIKAAFWLEFAAFLTVFFSVINRLTGSRRSALIFTFMLASIKQFNDQAVIGTADTFLGAAVFLAFVYLYGWVKEKNAAYLFMSLVFCLIAFWTKNEGTAVLAIYILVLAAYTIRRRENKENRAKALLVIILLLSVLAAWYGYKSAHAIDNDVLTRSNMEKIDLIGMVKRVPYIINEYQRQIFGFKKWNIVWVLFIMAAVYLCKMKLIRRYAVILFPIAGLLIFYTGIYLVTHQDISWHLKSTGSRIFLHFLPLGVLVIAFAVKERDSV